MTALFIRLVVPVWIAATLAAAIPVKQTGMDLTRLTVPLSRLPDGCSLSTVPSVQRVLIGTQSEVIIAKPESPIPSNPWRGEDRTIAAAIRRLVDGVPREPDGPPLDAEALIAFGMRWADSVAEAYGATYIDSGQRIGVYAVRFTDAALATADPPAGTTFPAHGATTRLVVGPTAVRVVARTPGACYTAIGDYLRTIR